MRTAGSPSTWTRLAWFAAIWAGSVATLGIVALAIRWVLRP
jgi:hypothetical protein